MLCLHAYIHIYSVTVYTGMYSRGYEWRENAQEHAVCGYRVWLSSTSGGRSCVCRCGSVTGRGRAIVVARWLTQRCSDASLLAGSSWPPGLSYLAAHRSHFLGAGSVLGGGWGGRRDPWSILDGCFLDEDAHRGCQSSKGFTMNYTPYPRRYY